MPQVVQWEAEHVVARQRLEDSSAAAQGTCSEESAAAALRDLEASLRSEGITDPELGRQLSPEAPPPPPPVVSL